MPGRARRQAITNATAASRASAHHCPTAQPCRKKRALELGCFFDGTDNNIDRDERTRPTNVARLFRMYRVGDGTMRGGMPTTRDSHYLIGVGAGGGDIEGQSTEGTNKAWGGATGYGMRDRCRLMYEWLKDTIFAHRNRHTLDSPVFVDIFGFSRGATTARTFVNIVNEALPRHITAHFFRDVTVRFVGIFDTVESLLDPAKIWKLGPATIIAHERAARHDEGMNLGLDDDSYTACRHFTANGEIRKNFPLTLLTPGTEEKGYPGCHSDVGGGYPDGDQDKLNWLAFVPLQDMYDAARANGVPLNPPRLPAGCDLTQLRPASLGIAVDAVPTGTGTQAQAGIHPASLQFRRNWIHQSWDDSLGWKIVNGREESNRRRTITVSKLRINNPMPPITWHPK
jgi:hypothetical protein